MGQKFAYYKFPYFQNPFGILYQPSAIENLLQRALEMRPYTEKEVFFHDESWHCYDAHSELNQESPEQLLKVLNQQLQVTNGAVYDSTHLLITLGTAWVYRHGHSGASVANCHKVPQKEFDNELLSAEAVGESLKRMVDIVGTANKDLHCILTISPVRHLKDGFTGNQRSKAHLISAVHETLEARKGKVSYFPSYEILMDELRDYRFYEADLLHPNAMAVEFIWEQFKNACIDPGAHEIMKDVAEIQKALQHKPFNPRSDKYREFRERLEEKIAQLRERQPAVKFEL